MSDHEHPQLDTFPVYETGTDDGATLRIENVYPSGGGCTEDGVAITIDDTDCGATGVWDPEQAIEVGERIKQAGYLVLMRRQIAGGA